MKATLFIASLALAFASVPTCELDGNGRTIVYYDSARHTSGFKCTHGTNGCECTDGHPSHPAAAKCMELDHVQLDGSTKTLQAGGDCENQCSANTCLNGGACTDGDNTYTCSCINGFVGNNCETNPSNCDGRADGQYTLTINGQSRTANCANGWIIMRTDLDSGWLTNTYFASYGSYDTNSGTIYGPSYNAIMQSNMDQTRHSGWFTLSGATFGTSEDCTSMSATNNVGYYASGNYMPSPSRGRCQYYNRNCDELSDGTCRTCASNYQSQQAGGTCAHRVANANSEYPFYQGNCHHWWNRFPSASGSGNGKWCMAYKV